MEFRLEALGQVRSSPVNGFTDMPYTAKLPQVEAVQWTGEIASVRQVFTEASVSEDGQTCYVPSPIAGSIIVPLGYWVTVDAFGTINVVADEHFALLYEPSV